MTGDDNDLVPYGNLWHVVGFTIADIPVSHLK